jgi:WXG100 family type VII secretion target
MTDIVKVTPSDLRATASGVQAEAEEAAATVMTLTNELKQILASWEGEGAMAYGQRFAQWVGEMADKAEKLSDTATAMTRSANLIETTDQEVASWWKG